MLKKKLRLGEPFLAVWYFQQPAVLPDNLFPSLTTAIEEV
jgi:hypothetical protein